MKAPRLTVRIDRLRVNAATQGDGAAFAQGLRTALQAQLSAQMTQGASSFGAQNTPHLSLNSPPAAGLGPTAVGRQTGQQIAGALSRSKGGL